MNNNKCTGVVEQLYILRSRGGGVLCFQAGWESRLAAEYFEGGLRAGRGGRADFGKRPGRFGWV